MGKSKVSTIPHAALPCGVGRLSIEVLGSPLTAMGSAVGVGVLVGVGVFVAVGVAEGVKVIVGRGVAVNVALGVMAPAIDGSPVDPSPDCCPGDSFLQPASRSRIINAATVRLIEKIVHALVELVSKIHQSITPGKTEKVSRKDDL